MNKAFRLCVVFVCATVLGCATAEDDYATRHTTASIAPGTQVAPGSRVLMVPLSDGVGAEDGPAVGTGEMVTAALRDALMSHGYRPLVSGATDLDSALAEARDRGYAYVLRGRITEWENSRTQWTGNPDMASLSVEIYDVSTGDLAGSASHQVRGAADDNEERSPTRFAPELADATLGGILGWSAAVRVDR